MILALQIYAWWTLAALALIGFVAIFDFEEPPKWAQRPLSAIVLPPIVLLLVPAVLVRDIREHGVRAALRTAWRELKDLFR